MPRITDIKRQKRSTDRFSVYIDGAYRFALGDLELSASGLRVGSELSLEQVEDWQAEAGQSKLYAKALNYLSYRPRSRREVADYLKRQEAEPEQIERILAELQRLRLVDDTQFARSWIDNRQTLRPRSRRRLEQELMAKGLASDIILQALTELEPESELKTLVELAEKKRRLPQYQQTDKLMAYLGRQGYSYDLIKKALARLSED